jgi:hypothetical protein
VRLFRESVVLKPAEASFRNGWKEALAGETKPVSNLWGGIDAIINGDSAHSERV